MQGPGQRGGIPNGGVVQSPPTQLGATVHGTPQLTNSQLRQLKERAAERYCPECGTFFKPKDVKWIRGTPACRVCGFKPLRKVK